MRNTSHVGKLLGSGLTLAAVLGTTVLFQGTAFACSEPDTGTKAGKTFPFVTDENPYYWEPNANAPAGGTGAPAGGATADPRPPTTRDALLFRFTAGDDRDSDPNRDYFKHAHRAYTLVTVTDAKTGAVVRTDKVPVWHYGAIDSGTARQGDEFKRIEAVRLDALPAGQYTIKTQALFIHPDGRASSAWGGDKLEGAPATASLTVEKSPDPAPTATGDGSQVLVGEGCSSTGSGHSRFGWLALGGVLFALARRRQR